MQCVALWCMLMSASTCVCVHAHSQVLAGQKGGDSVTVLEQATDV